jgi:hypothetical protein
VSEIEGKALSGWKKEKGQSKKDFISCIMIPQNMHYCLPALPQQLAHLQDYEGIQRGVLSRTTTAAGKRGFLHPLSRKVLTSHAFLDRMHSRSMKTGKYVAAWRCVHFAYHSRRSTSNNVIEVDLISSVLNDFMPGFDAQPLLSKYHMKLGNRNFLLLS